MERIPGEHIFHCRSPIFMCPTCSRAEGCTDLLYLLEVFKVEEIKKDEEEAAFPFLKPREPGQRQDRRNKFNDLTSGEWLRFTRSAFPSRLPLNLGHHLRRKHAEYKNPYLFGQLIAFFTQSGDLVLDPFAGTGSSLIAASILSREALGFETDSEWIELYHKICSQERIARQNLLHGDCRALIDHVPDESVDFIILDPPNPTADEKMNGRSGEEKLNIENYFELIKEVLSTCRRVLKPNKYLAVFTRDLYADGEYISLNPQIISIAAEAGFVLKGEKIWENPGEKLRPYGYPHSYVPNIVHWTVLIFRKR
ncbi:MAG: DNA methyltransferase [bacterium]